MMWHRAGGPDAVSNGLALCALHHRLIDRGVFTVRAATAHERLVQVSDDAHGGEGFERWVLAFHDRPVAEPVYPDDRVAEPSLAWHHREVFRGRERP
jgi:putative restriction endonuclease